MFNLPFAPRFSVAPMFIGALAILLFLLEPWSFNLLAYDRSAVSELQLWRLFSGNLLHSNTAHLGMNLLALLAVWALFGEYMPAQRYTGLLVLIGLFCTICIYYFAPERGSYVGLSGIIHGLLIYGSIIDIRHKIWLGWLLFAGVILKIVHEQLVGPSAATAELINTAVATESHLYGAIGGALCGVAVLITQQRSSEEGTENDR